MTLVAIGLVVGGISVIALTRLIAAMLLGVGARDPLTLLVVAAILFLVTLVACGVLRPPRNQGGSADRPAG